MAETALTDTELLERSDFLIKLQRRRLAPSRWQDLLRIARAPVPPRAPDPWDCCGSNCKPCVKELHREQLRVWKEVHPDGPDETIEEDDIEAARRDENEAHGRREALKERQDRASPKVEIEVELKGLALQDNDSNDAHEKRTALKDW